MIHRLLILSLFAAGLMVAAVSITSGQAPAPTLSNPATLTERAPATYKAKFETSKGEFIIEVTRDWAPNGADRFYNLVKNGFYDGVRFFRVIPGFMAQGGMNGDPAIQKVWGRANFNDDPVAREHE